ncbi:TSUP family transporter [Myxococcota bacterium]|nr:TSUP family transporter [Myxococcota bacterium]
MELFVVPLAALVASALTLFSGFGLGTLLMPVVAIFFPIDVAIAMTAVVHLANNLFKGGLVGRHADRGVVLRFGLPAVAAALLGAWLLGRLAGGAPLFTWEAFGHGFEGTLLGVVVGLVILGFVAFELSPRAASIALDARWLPVGGIVSGFFGGLSGHQGAFRSMFLLKAGLGKQAFVATGVLVAVLVDLARTAVYGLEFLVHETAIDWPLVAAACLAAFAGAYLGSRWLEKVTIEAVRRIVSAMLVAIGLGLVSGLI